MPESEAPATIEAPKQRTPRLSAEKALPQSAADTLVRIIKGYAIASSGGQAKINYKDVASAAGISPFVVSGNNRFLLDSQILSSPKYGYYVPTEDAVRFAREAAWDESGAKAHLRRIVANVWFGQVVSQNFALRSQLTRPDLKRALAIKSGATEGDSAALDYLIDFIIYTGLVLEDEHGVLKKGEVSDLETGDELPVPALVGVDAQHTPQTSSKELTRPTGLALHIHIHDLDDLTPENAKRVRDWIGRLTDDGGNAEVHFDQPNLATNRDDASAST
jgi:hypothetical protein